MEIVKELKSQAVFNANKRTEESDETTEAMIIRMAMEQDPTTMSNSQLRKKVETIDMLI